MGGSRRYIGRFAPSPTGPLHFGSLVAALGSHLDARAHDDHWLSPREGVDEPRCSQAHADAILRVLEAYGFEWDGEVVYPSRRKERYQAALTRPIEAGRAPCAWRVRVGSEPVCFDDRLQEWYCQNLAADIGDFVVQRADAYFAYQPAVVVDDADQNVSHVVRGADLMASTPRQIHLQRLLGYATPEYLHLPVAVNALGQKLGKQTLAAPLAADRTGPALVAALRFLSRRQKPASCMRAERKCWPGR